MKNTFYLPTLLILLIFSSCNNLFHSTITDTIEIEIQKENLDSRYEKIYSLIRAIDVSLVSDKVKEVFLEKNIKNLEHTATYTVHKIEQRLATNINGENSSSGSNTINIEISIKHTNANSEQMEQIMEHHKTHIINELGKHNINVKIKQ